MKTKTTKEYNLAYSRLNAEQKQAVDTIEGPVMLVAGPGTGKTQTLALRIANILKKTDTQASSILALTYTESGARAMKARLTKMIGTEAYYANIATFHAFCQGVIQDNPDFFTHRSSADPMSDLDKLKLIYSLIDETSLTHLRPVGSVYHYAVAIQGAIGDLKREAVDPDEFEEVLRAEEHFLGSDEAQELKASELAKRRRNQDKNRELYTIYKGYQQKLRDSHSFDFEDMITTVVDAFKSNAELLLTYQERYHYILVDEYQDTNSGQNELILKLAEYWGDRANLFVTGDPDQAIMRFQGASIENQLSFIKQYPAATVITLKQNYRSTQNILDAAASVISNNNLRISDVVPGIDPDLISQSGAGPALSLVALSSGTSEMIYIADDIRQKIKSGVSASEIAIIYHNNSDSVGISSILNKYGIDYNIQGGADVLSDSTVRNFLKILRVIYDLRTQAGDEDLFTILHYDIFGIDPLDILKIARAAGRSRSTLFDVLSSAETLDSLKLATRAAIDATFASLCNWQKVEADYTFVEFFEHILNTSKYLSWVLDEGVVYPAQSRGANHRLARLNTLFDEVKRMNRSDPTLTLHTFLANLAIMEDNHLRVEESSYGVSESAITLTTAHKSKGLEWEHVYIYRAIDGKWGNNRRPELITLPGGLLKNVKPEDKEKNEDERRLFYVAATRAKSSLTITHAKTYSQYGKAQEASPTMFISELPEELVTSCDTSSAEQRAHDHLETILSMSQRAVTDDSERAYLTDIVDHFKLAATSLNSYLFCAYKFKLDKLLKVPHAKKAHLSYGTAIHGALENFYLKYKDEGVVPSLDYLLTEFSNILGSTLITKGDLALYLDKGTRVLTSYYEQGKGSFSLPLATEKSLSANLGDIQLTGKLDRLEWSDQKEGLVRVVDYKTGKPKTMGQIRGETQDSEGELLRQIEFYKLLVDLDPTLNYKFGEGVLDFVEEPSLKSKPGERRIQVTEDQVEDLKVAIKSAMDNIRSLNFERTTDLKKCEKCYFIDHCYPNGLPSQ